MFSITTMASSTTNPVAMVSAISERLSNGHTPDDAADRTQEFFARLLEKGWLDGVAREKGKFRSFLLASMKHFLSNERDREAALKRGGNRTFNSLDANLAESRYLMEPIDTTTPEQIFDRRWALTLLEQVLGRLRSEFAASGKAKLFDSLKGTLPVNRRPTPIWGSRWG